MVPGGREETPVIGSEGETDLPPGVKIGRALVRLADSRAAAKAGEVSRAEQR